jgi:hypothetical protein
MVGKQTTLKQQIQSRSAANNFTPFVIGHRKRKFISLYTFGTKTTLKQQIQSRSAANNFTTFVVGKKKLHQSTFHHIESENDHASKTTDTLEIAPTQFNLFHVVNNSWIHITVVYQSQVYSSFVKGELRFLTVMLQLLSRSSLQMPPASLLFIERQNRGTPILHIVYHRSNVLQVNMFFNTLMLITLLSQLFYRSTNQ